jgi:hypothetical protein
VFIVIKSTLATLTLSTFPIIAEAQSDTVNLPTGDVWITPQSSYSFRPRTGESAPPRLDLRSGDVWLIPEDVDPNAETKVPQSETDQTKAEAVVKMR